MTDINDKLKTAWIRQLNEDWKMANFLYFKDSMRPQTMNYLIQGVALGRWKGGCHRRLSISIVLINTYAWEYVQEVLCHEMVHQYVEEVLGICEELPTERHSRGFARKRELIQRLRVTFKAGWKSAKTDSP